MVSPTVHSIRENIKKELGIIYPGREIDTLTHILYRHRLDLRPHEIGLRKHEILMPYDAEWFEMAIIELKKGKPVQYLTGETEFFGLVLKVSPAALIPRPETEELVQWIIDGQPAQGSRILDVGTGTGCIALALASKLPGSRVLAGDISGKALELARENARILKLDVGFFQQDITVPTNGEPHNLDILVANPPYIPESDKSGMQSNVTDHEPPEALFVPDDDPLLFYRYICKYAKEALNPGGYLYFEIHERFGAEVRNLMEIQGFNEVEIRRDINEKDRMARGRKA